ncbi:MAG: PQQ-binding-like beta-propeller repeat protein [Tepidisphaeraceae bacterium]
MNRLVLLSVSIAISLSAFPVMAADATAPAAEWPCFRGPNGDGTVAELPKTLPPAPKVLWKTKAAGTCHAGIAVAAGVVVTPDCDEDNDYYRCLDAATGAEQWVRTFTNGRDLQYGPGPRATPLISKGKVYVLSAFGELRCLDLKTGKTLWEKSYQNEFRTRSVPTWGFCGSPLLVQDKLLLHPKRLLALDPDTGNVVWEGDSSGTNYATPLVGAFGGVDQVIDYEPAGMAGWDIKTGKRLWTIEIEAPHGYIVPTPVRVGTRLLIVPSAEDARLLDFDQNGRPKPDPTATCDQLTSEVITPTVSGDLILGAGRGLLCLDAKDKLNVLWKSGKESTLRADMHIVASKDRVLTFNRKGYVTLVALNRDALEVLGSARLCQPTLMPPAVAGQRIYVRDDESVCCYDLSASIE